MRGRFVYISLLGIILCLHSHDCRSFSPDSVSNNCIYPVMFWNLENYFDPFDDSLTNDDEFTPWGDKHWTWRKFISKRNMIAKTIIAVKDLCGCYPVIAAFAECENKFVISQMIYKTALSRLDYGIIHKDSPDIRGIDVAMIYRKEFFIPLNTETIRIDSLQRPTRDILKVTGIFKNCTKDTIDFYIVHLPSKLGDPRITNVLRERIIGVLVDDINVSQNKGRKVILTGDFNDEASSPAMKIIPDTLLENLAASESLKGLGTIKFNGKWEIIDQFLISPNMINITSEMEILDFPFLLENDNKFLGKKPFRTYYGPRYNHGISDHLPILIRIYCK